jgi:hypothetical protein
MKFWGPQNFGALCSPHILYNYRLGPAKGGMACHIILPPLSKAAWPTTVTACLRVGLGDGGTPMPALAQAARATCRLAKRAATRRGSFLTKIFAGGLF